MKLSTIITPLFLIPYASSFPSYAGPEGGPRGLKERQLPFDPISQKISVTGNHAFIPPRATDRRGPCPGLNALANHGYLPRDGVTTFTQAVSATTDVFGLGVEGAVALAAVGVATAGDMSTLKFSIGRPPPLTLLEVLTAPITGRPVGLSGTHSSYESDSSATRGDSYLFGGDADSLRLEYLQQLLDLSGGIDDFTSPAIWTAHRIERFEHSIAHNPNFFFGPFSGLLVSEAGIFLPRQLWANRTAEEPEKGVLPKSVLLSFLGVQESADGQLVYTPGHERIPDNWYRRSRLAPYTAVSLIQDLAALIVAYPRAGSVGGNTGTVNSFAGLDMGDMTGGVYHAADLRDPGKLACFLYSVCQIAIPQVLRGALTNIIGGDILAGLIPGLECPQLVAIDQSMFTQFPGAKPFP